MDSCLVCYGIISSCCTCLEIVKYFRQVKWVSLKVSVELKSRALRKIVIVVIIVIVIIVVVVVTVVVVSGKKQQQQQHVDEDEMKALEAWAS